MTTRLKTLRKLAGLTLIEVDRRTGINKSRLSEAETGKKKLATHEMFMLRSVLTAAAAEKMKAEEARNKTPNQAA